MDNFSANKIGLALRIVGFAMATTALVSFTHLFHFQDDAPAPLSPQEAQGAFRLPSGFKIELVAAEPLIQEPTGVCWDEHGNLYVSELHGYNLEGQLEIEELNKTGVVDTLVRRVQAADRHKKEAEKGTYGTIKKLYDTNGDGQMDKAVTFADHLSPAYGLCAARGGIVVAGQAEVVFVADRNGDDRADVVDTLFAGFQGGALERGLNAPQWGPDGWIYLGRGWNGGKITGKYLKNPVHLPGSNFRIRADGSAIEAITGSTHTIGHAFTPDGYSFLTNTWKHALYAAPIDWKYLSRNPDAVIGSLEADASDYSSVFPLAPVHPWKLARSNQEEWRKYYDKYGLAESASGGYFTSSCSPLVYQDNLFPVEYKNNLFVCEPAQCLVHRCLVLPDGTGLKVKRAPTEQNREFLATTDAWFRPVSSITAPDGSLYITDMYREIIEDYSAVPRFMQQKYGLKNGVTMGRIWRVSPTAAPALATPTGLWTTGKKIAQSLEKQLDSPHYWVRQTADRLLRQQQGDAAPALLKRQFSLQSLTAQTSPVAFVNTLRRADTLLKTDVPMARRLAAMSREITNERMLLQLALSLGYSQDSQVFETLTDMARRHAHIRWMPDAILTGVPQRAGQMLQALLAETGAKGQLMLEPLAESVAARAHAPEINQLLVAVQKNQFVQRKTMAMRGLNKNIKPVTLDAAAQKSLEIMLNAPHLALKGQAVGLASKLNLGDSKALDALRQQAVADAANAALATDQRLAAVALLADAPDALAGPALVKACTTAPLPLKTIVLDALIARGNRLGYLVEALESGQITTSTLSPTQRTRLLERANGSLRPRLEDTFARTVHPDKEAMYARYALALNAQPNPKNGQQRFEQMCGICHQINQIGVAVGPDLKNSFSNANETILRNILFPNEKIASSYEVYTVQTTDNQSFSGILVSESANSVVLRQAGGSEQTFLRKNIAKFSSSPTSLMPEYAQVLSPQDCADIIGWMKRELAKK